MKRIEYSTNTPAGIAVYLDGKHAGTIRSELAGWRYYPNGQKVGGDLFPTVVACKDSLESE